MLRCGATPSPSLMVLLTKGIIQTNNINVFMRKAANVTEGLIRETNLYQFDHLAAAQGTWGPGTRVTLPREADLWTTISFLWLNI